MKKAQVVLSLILLISISGIKAQSPEYFNNAYDYQNQLELAFDVVQLEDSGYLTLAGTTDYLNTGTVGSLLNWYSNTGILDSQKCVFSPDADYYPGEPGSFYNDKAGGYFFGGSTNKSPDTINYMSFGLLVRYASSGDTLFTKTFGDSSKYQLFYGSYQMHDSGYILVGSQFDYSNNNLDYYVVRVNKNGNLLWEKKFHGWDDDMAFKAFELSNRNIVIAGAREFTSAFYQPWIIITDSSGNLLNDRIFSSAFKCGGARVTPAHNNDRMIMWGCLDTVITTGDYQYPRYVALVNSDFNVFWQTIFHGKYITEIRNAKQFSDGSIIAVGDWVDSLGNDLGWAAKLDSNGNIIWEHSYQYHSSFFNELEDVWQTKDSGYIICGVTLNDLNNQDVWLIKVDSNGCLEPGCVINTGTIQINVSSVSFEVYPNPAQDVATINLSIPRSIKDAYVIVFDVNGRRLTRINTPVSGSYTIDSGNWPSGVYFCTVLVNGISALTKKLLIQK